ncbi:MAG: prolipoprotein diacylglyceryl transferase [Bdellovibrio sp.]|nr:MAG: prolipoprotein diacylglyceryl transferase [Bdellovibrio sp.]
MQPEISVGSLVGLPTYFVVLSLVYSFLIFSAWKWAQICGFPQDHALNLALLSIVSGVVGARVFHVLYESPDYYLLFPNDAFRLWQGGFVFYGGFTAALASCWIYLRVHRLNFWRWADLAAPLCAMGVGLGRIACFMAGCCFGKTCDLPWAFHGRHPVQLYITFLELGYAALLFRLSLRRPTQAVQSIQVKLLALDGSLFWLWILLHSFSRLWMEWLRADDRGPLVGGFTISTWISWFLAGLALAWFGVNGLRRRAS